MKQHSHGADVLETIKKYGVEKLMDFSSNVNIFTPAKIEQLIQEIKAEDLAKYPDIHYTQLRDKLSKKYKLASEQIIVGNGSTELIFLLARNANRIGIINPTFGEYQRAAEIFGKEVVHFFYDEQFQLHIDSIDLQNVDLLFVCNPNNPSGNTNSLVELIKKAEITNTLVMVDETFMDFVENGGAFDATIFGRISKSHRAQGGDEILFDDGRTFGLCVWLGENHFGFMVDQRAMVYQCFC